MQIHRSEDSGEIFAGLLALENRFAPGLCLGRRTQRTQPGDDFVADLGERPGSRQFVLGNPGNCLPSRAIPKWT